MLPVYSVFGFSVSGEAARFGRLVLLHVPVIIPAMLSAVCIRKGKYVICQGLHTNKNVAVMSSVEAGYCTRSVLTFSILFAKKIGQDSAFYR